MLSLKSNSRLESLDAFHKRGYDTLNNTSRKLNCVTSYQVC